VRPKLDSRTRLGTRAGEHADVAARREDGGQLLARDAVTDSGTSLMFSDFFWR
jgi:hypothetical protein